MLTETSDYAKLTRDFCWNVPEHFNIGTATVDRHADGSGRAALIDVLQRFQKADMVAEVFNEVAGFHGCSVPC